MKTMLRNLANRWANKTMRRLNTNLRHDLIRAQAALERAAQVQRNAATDLAAATDVLAGCRRQRDRAERQRDDAWAELELVREVVLRALTWRDAVAEASAVGVDHTIDAANRATRELMAAIDALPKSDLKVRKSIGGQDVRS